MTNTKPLSIHEGSSTSIIHGDLRYIVNGDPDAVLDEATAIAKRASRRALVTSLWFGPRRHGTLKPLLAFTCAVLIGVTAVMTLAAEPRPDSAGVVGLAAQTVMIAAFSVATGEFIRVELASRFRDELTGALERHPAFIEAIER